jgi:hypothetical protein
MTMGHRFHELVDEALSVERELRVLRPGKPSLRCFISECLSRAGATYPEVEDIKSRLEDTGFEKASGTGAYVRHLTREIAAGRLREPPEAGRIGRMAYNMKDQTVLELGGQPERLFLLWIIAAELAHQRTDGDVFGAVEDLATHKARIGELEKKRGELYAAFPTTWSHNDLHIGRITSDGAALITLKLAAGEIPVHPPSTAGERLIEYLLRKEHETEAKAA